MAQEIEDAVFEETNQAEEIQDAGTADIDLTFALKLSQANIILAALDEIPHKLSRTIIDSLQQQALLQLQNPVQE